MIEEKLHNWRLRDARMSSDKERGEKQVVCPFLLLATINVAVVVDLAHVVCFLVCECALRVVWDRDGRGGGRGRKRKKCYELRGCLSHDCQMWRTKRYRTEGIGPGDSERIVVCITLGAAAVHTSESTTGGEEKRKQNGLILSK